MDTFIAKNIIRNSKTDNNIGDKDVFAIIQAHPEQTASDCPYAVILYQPEERLIGLYPDMQTAVENYQSICRMIQDTYQLNKASEAYYGGQDEIISNYEWDALFDELTNLEQRFGFCLDNSPTQQVSDSASDNQYGGQEPHEFPALSLAKSKNINDLQHWAGDKPIWLSWKLDGLTLVATYDDGKLTKLVTRGDGHVGTNITYMAAYIQNLPLQIAYPHHLVVRGEAVIATQDFELINAELEEPYANPRNLASGTLSLRPEDAEEIRNRHVQFIPFTLVYLDSNPEQLDMNAWGDRMQFLNTLGFTPVEHKATRADLLPQDVQLFTEKLQTGQCPFPVDGLVICYDDIAYSQTGSVTGHHATRGGFAFKWPDTSATTVLRNIEWSCAVSVITPIAIFDPVSLEGTTVSRASLVNISEIKRLGIGQPGDTTLEIIKSNMIIPKVISANTTGDILTVPDTCPVCGHPTRVNISASGAETLVCTNPHCAAKQLMRFVRFAGKDGLDIDGLSVKTLELFINAGLLCTLDDIFLLQKHQDKICNLPGMGERSCEKLLQAIESARSVSAVKFIKSLSIPMIGRDAAKRIFDTIGYQGFLERLQEHEHFDDIEGIGPERDKAIQTWFDNSTNRDLFDNLCAILDIADHPAKQDIDGVCKDKVFVITGSLTQFANRSAMKAYIESQGGKVAGSVSKNTDFLINNDNKSTSAKNRKAQELGIPILTESDFIAHYNMPSSKI